MFIDCHPDDEVWSQWRNFVTMMTFYQNDESVSQGWIFITMQYFKLISFRVINFYCVAWFQIDISWWAFINWINFLMWWTFGGNFIAVLTLIIDHKNVYILYSDEVSLKP